MSFFNARRVRRAAGVAAVLVAIGCVAGIVSSGVLDGRGDHDAAAQVRRPAVLSSQHAGGPESALPKHDSGSEANAVAATAGAHDAVAKPLDDKSPESSIGGGGQQGNTAQANRQPKSTGAASVIDVPPGPQPPSMAGVRWSTGHLRIGRYERSWWLATPDHPVAAKLPLLMILHGRTASPASEAVRTGFLPDVAAGRALAVYPAGYRASWNAGRCCGYAHAAGVDDLTFLTQLASAMQARPDVNRFDLVGFSNGAKMAFDLVCSGRLRPHAMAVAEAVPTTDCSHAPAVAMIQVAGTADPIVPYSAVDPKLVADGVPLVPVLTDVDGWAARNGCASTPSSSIEGMRQLQVWTRCRAAVDLLTYAGGTHTWQPGATPLIWAFLNGTELAPTSSPPSVPVGSPSGTPASGIPSVDVSPAPPTTGSQTTPTAPPVTDLPTVAPTQTA
ncbi:MAG: alpha/beta hydrolase family esterase [Acidothermaceae bacterium]